MQGNRPGSFIRINVTLELTDLIFYHRSKCLYIFRWTVYSDSTQFDTSSKEEQQEAKKAWLSSLPINLINHIYAVENANHAVVAVVARPLAVALVGGGGHVVLYYRRTSPRV